MGVRGEITSAAFSLPRLIINIRDSILWKVKFSV